MYYRSVNRGLAFTKPGVYSFGFVLAVGMIAVATGINGLYVFLSAGLGGFIVSGILSERAMKSCRVRRASADIVDADTAFQLTFNIENTSAWFTVYAVQTMFFLEKPRARLLSRPLPSLSSHLTGKLEPGMAATCTAGCIGLPRGAYSRLLAMQQTVFPFGILEKYKFGHVDAGLLVTPGVDVGFLAEIRALVRRRLALNAADNEFFSHRRYLRTDSLRYLDWRKSAGRKPEDWVIKVFRARDLHAPVVVECPWSTLLACTSTDAYEALLRRVRTACLAVAEIGRRVRLDLGGAGLVVDGYDGALAALARLPSFTERQRGTVRLDGRTSTQASELRLHVAEAEARWAA